MRPEGPLGKSQTSVPTGSQWHLLYHRTARTISSDSQWCSDTRPACARIGCRPCRPRTARRGSRGVRALFFNFCADIERYPTADRFQTSRPRIARRGSWGARALFFSLCADTERYPTADRFQTSLRTHWLSALPTTHRLRRPAARESACPPADRCSWHRNAPLSSRTGFPDSKSAGCPSPDP